MSVVFAFDKRLLVEKLFLLQTKIRPCFVRCRFLRHTYGQNSCKTLYMQYLFCFCSTCFLRCWFDICVALVYYAVMEKTNAMRILDKQGINYKVWQYDNTLTDGKLVAQACGRDGQQVFKTLVTVGNDLNHYVFVIPVEETLSLKKAAKSVGVKSVAMIKQKELFPLTGYIHGGCSPIGMKKQFVTVFNDTAMLFDTICFSGGRVGVQLEAEPQQIVEFLKAKFDDITEY